MRPRVSPGPFSWVVPDLCRIGGNRKGKGLYRKTIGKYQRADRTIAPRDFWLGPDQVQATFLATRLQQYWKSDLEPWGLVWDAQHGEEARTLAQAWQVAWQTIVESSAAKAAKDLASAGHYNVPVKLPPDAVRGEPHSPVQGMTAKSPSVAVRLSRTSLPANRTIASDAMATESRTRFRASG